MSYAPRVLIFLLASLLLTGWGSCSNVKPSPPQTTVIGVPTKVYVPIPKELTKREPIADGPLREAPMVARERKKALQICYGQLETIEKVQGTPAPGEK